MAQEYTPELNEQVLASIRRQIEEDAAKKRAAARGEAVSRGITGGSFEARRVGSVDAASQRALADEMTRIAIEDAGRKREERLLKEQRSYITSEREATQGFQAKQQELQNQFNALEAEKQRAYLAGEADKVRQFEAQQADIQRQYEAFQNRRQANTELVGQGIGALGQLGGTYLSYKLAGANQDKLLKALGYGGSGAPAVAGATPAVAGATPAGAGIAGKGLTATMLSGDVPVTGAGTGSGLTSTLTQGGAAASTGGGIGLGAVGLGALGVAAQYGQTRFAQKNLGVTKREALLTSPIPGGATMLGVAKKAGKAIERTGISGERITGGSVGKVIKKLCFSPDTLIAMADGTYKEIGNLHLGDETKGGLVLSIRASLTPHSELYDYCGVKVTGSHAVREGGVWKRVEDSEHAVPVAERDNTPITVVSVVTTGHRVYTHEVTFADEYETDNYEHLTIEQSLDELNKEEKSVLEVTH